MSTTILQLDASPRGKASLSRQVTGYITEQLKDTDSHVIHRDLARSELPLLTEGHIGAFFTPPGERSDEQKQLLTISDALIGELKQAQQLIIGAPIYNFSVPAALKAWIDLVCRTGETFSYTENGPEGLLNIEQAFIAVAAGGVEIGSPVDFNSVYLKQVCHFIGIKNVHIIDVSGSKRDPETLIDHAKAQVDTLLATA